MSDEELDVLRNVLTPEGRLPLCKATNAETSTSISDKFGNNILNAAPRTTFKQDQDIADFVIAACNSFHKLLAHIAVLEGVINDMRIDSDAYRIGMEEGLRLGLQDRTPYVFEEGMHGPWCWRWLEHSQEAAEIHASQFLLPSKVFRALSKGRWRSPWNGFAIVEYDSNEEAMEDLRSSIASVARGDA